MKSDDLRNGNWILNGINEEFQANIYTIQNFDKSILSGFKPIALSKKWLIKFGFQYIDDLEIWRLEFGLDSYEFVGSPNKICLIYGNKYLNQNINKVHEFQNIYFSITGNEIEIN